MFCAKGACSISSMPIEFFLNMFSELQLLLWLLDPGKAYHLNKARINIAGTGMLLLFQN